jgi:rsbT antagonist protein RsbS
VTTPILKLGHTLIVTLGAEPTDQEFADLERNLTERVGESRAEQVIIDVSALLVLDSFATRTLREVTEAARLRGARAAIVGIQPEVAFAMVQLGLSLSDTVTALDLEHGLALLESEATAVAA